MGQNDGAKSTSSNQEHAKGLLGQSSGGQWEQHLGHKPSMLPTHRLRHKE